MRLNLKGTEHLRIQHDSKLGFAIWIDGDTVHIRAKEADEPDAQKTTLVLDSRVEVSK